METDAIMVVESPPSPSGPCTFAAATTSVPKPKHNTQRRIADFPALVTPKNRVIPHKNPSTIKKGRTRNTPNIKEKSKGRTTRTKLNK